MPDLIGVQLGDENLTDSDSGYNQRLFGGTGLRSYLHHARFRWVRGRIEKERIAAGRVLEIGCFDAKFLQWLPRFPDCYYGIDANWEGGLDIARQKYGEEPRVHLIDSSDPRDLVDLPVGFNLGVSMETLEHVPAMMLAAYLDVLASHVKGNVIFTVPVEIGPVFAIKWLVKRWILGSAEYYSAREFLFALFGKSSGIARNEHKGFDYREFVHEVEAHFQTVEVESIHGKYFPLWLSFGVGVTATTPGYK